MSSLTRPATLQVEVLDDDDRAELVEFADTDPIANSVISSRLHVIRTLDHRAFGGVVLGVRDETGRLAGAAFSGGNLLPIGGTPEVWTRLAHAIAVRSRVCSSIVGPADAVATMWRVLEPVWGAARAIREEQPLLLREWPVTEPGDARVRMIRPPELEAYLPAAAAMFTEELGVSPLECAGASDYHDRVARLIRDGRAFGIVDDTGSLLFKADLGSISLHTCQVQGVWVRPDLRGHGLGTAALATVFNRALTLAPTVSLYVNAFNEPARRMYDRLGMRQVGTLATVLF